MNRRFSSHVALIELTAALLVLMLASVTILGLFTAADRKSGQAGALTEAVVFARDLSARICASEQPERMLLDAGFIGARDGYSMAAPSGMTAFVTLEEEQTEVGILTSGRIALIDGENVVFEMPVSRYINKEVIRP